MAYHNLIPEAVYHFTCATFEKRKAKRYGTPFGSFLYRDVPSDAYPIHILLKIENGYAFQIATAEKTICDMLYTVSPLGNKSHLAAYLFDGLRIMPADFEALDLQAMLTLCACYRTQNHKLLAAWIQKMQKGGSHG